MYIASTFSLEIIARNKNGQKIRILNRNSKENETSES